MMLLRSLFLALIIHPSRLLKQYRRSPLRRMMLSLLSSANLPKQLLQSLNSMRSLSKSKPLLRLSTTPFYKMK